MGRARLAALAFVVLALAPLTADAQFHLWRIKEIFSNADGSIQYIELYCDSAGQGVLTGHTLTATDGTTTHTFTFPTDLTVSTLDKHLLIATPGFANLPGAVTPDYTLPCGSFFSPAASQIEIDFAGFDAVMFAGSTLPTDGVNSLTDTNLTPNVASLVSGANSPTNVSSQPGSLTLTADQISGAAPACNDGNYCNGVETCSAGACSGVAPCAQQCIEATDTCVECTADIHCNDNNPCTDDTCNGSNTCEHVAHVGSCDDGLFCNGADTCSGTTCTHAGDPCAGINCNEGPDTCANCTGPADCEDGEPCTVDTCTTGQCNRATAADGADCDTDTTFCNGAGSCTAGVCGGTAAPCDPMTETCEESNDSCTPIGTIPPDAPGTVNPIDDDDEGGCCQANTSPATFSGPGLVLLLGLAFGRRRVRARCRRAARST
jgi:hypothetical protein